MMGLMNKLNPLSGSDDDGDIEIEDDFGGDDSPEFVDDTGGSIEDEVAEDGQGENEPDEELEWDSAYKFAEWYLEDFGFADMTDFGEKAMMRELERSPMYRDRIETGLETLGAIRNAKEDLETIRGNSTKESDYGQLADKVEDADRLIKGVRSLSGEDEVMVQQGMSLAREALGAIAQKSGGQAANVDTETRRRSESIDG